MFVLYILHLCCFKKSLPLTLSFETEEFIINNYCITQLKTKLFKSKLQMCITHYTSEHVCNALRDSTASEVLAEYENTEHILKTRRSTLTKTP